MSLSTSDHALVEKLLDEQKKTNELLEAQICGQDDIIHVLKKIEHNTI